MAFVDAEQQEWKNEGSRYRRVLPGFVELEVRADGQRWRWTVLAKRRPVATAIAGSVYDAMRNAKACAEEKVSSGS
jgi:hypothetical protein